MAFFRKRSRCSPPFNGEIHIQPQPDWSPILPQIDTSQTPSPMIIRQGDSATVTVEVTGLPSPAVRWHIGNCRIASSAEYQITENGQIHRLFIARAKLELEEGVIITALNTVGMDRKKIDIKIYKVLRRHHSEYIREQRPRNKSTETLAAPRRRRFPVPPQKYKSLSRIETCIDDPYENQEEPDLADYIQGIRKQNRYIQSTPDIHRQIFNGSRRETSRQSSHTFSKTSRDSGYYDRNGYSNASADNVFDVVNTSSIIMDQQHFGPHHSSAAGRIPPSPILDDRSRDFSFGSDFNQYSRQTSSGVSSFFPADDEPPASRSSARYSGDSFQPQQEGVQESWDSGEMKLSSFVKSSLHDYRPDDVSVRSESRDDSHFVSQDTLRYSGDEVKTPDASFAMYQSEVLLAGNLSQKPALAPKPKINVKVKKKKDKIIDQAEIDNVVPMETNVDAYAPYSTEEHQGPEVQGYYPDEQSPAVMYAKDGSVFRLPMTGEFNPDLLSSPTSDRGSHIEDSSFAIMPNESINMDISHPDDDHELSLMPETPGQTKVKKKTVKKVKKKVSKTKNSDSIVTETIVESEVTSIGADNEQFSQSMDRQNIPLPAVPIVIPMNVYGEEENSEYQTIEFPDEQAPASPMSPGGTFHRRNVYEDNVPEDYSLAQSPTRRSVYDDPYDQPPETVTSAPPPEKIKKKKKRSSSSLKQQVSGEYMAMDSQGAYMDYNDDVDSSIYEDVHIYGGRRPNVPPPPPPTQPPPLSPSVEPPPSPPLAPAPPVPLPRLDSIPDFAPPPVPIEEDDDYEVPVVPERQMLITDIDSQVPLVGDLDRHPSLRNNYENSDIALDYSVPVQRREVKVGIKQSADSMGNNDDSKNDIPHKKLKITKKSKSESMKSPNQSADQDGLISPHQSFHTETNIDEVFAAQLETNASIEMKTTKVKKVKKKSVSKGSADLSLSGPGREVLVDNWADTTSAGVAGYVETNVDDIAYVPDNITQQKDYDIEQPLASTPKVKVTKKKKKTKLVEGTENVADGEISYTDQQVMDNADPGLAGEEKPKKKTKVVKKKKKVAKSTGDLSQLGTAELSLPQMSIDGEEYTDVVVDQSNLSSVDVTTPKKKVKKKKKKLTKSTGDLTGNLTGTLVDIDIDGGASQSFHETAIDGDVFQPYDHREETNLSVDITEKKTKRKKKLTKSTGDLSGNLTGELINIDIDEPQFHEPFNPQDENFRRTESKRKKKKTKSASDLIDVDGPEDIPAYQEVVTMETNIDDAINNDNFSTSFHETAIDEPQVVINNSTSFHETNVDDIIFEPSQITPPVDDTPTQEMPKSTIKKKKKKTKSADNILDAVTGEAILVDVDIHQAGEFDANESSTITKAKKVKTKKKKSSEDLDEKSQTLPDEFGTVVDIENTTDVKVKKKKVVKKKKSKSLVDLSGDILSEPIPIDIDQPVNMPPQYVNIDVNPEQNVSEINMEPQVLSEGLSQDVDMNMSSEKPKKKVVKKKKKLTKSLENISGEISQDPVLVDIDVNSLPEPPSVGVVQGSVENTNIDTTTLSYPVNFDEPSDVKIPQNTVVEKPKKKVKKKTKSLGDLSGDLQENAHLVEIDIDQPFTPNSSTIDDNRNNELVPVETPETLQLDRKAPARKSTRKKKLTKSMGDLFGADGEIEGEKKKKKKVKSKTDLSLTLPTEVQLIDYGPIDGPDDNLPTNDPVPVDTSETVELDRKVPARKSTRKKKLTKSMGDLFGADGQVEDDTQGEKTKKKKAKSKTDLSLTLPTDVQLIDYGPIDGPSIPDDDSLQTDKKVKKKKTKKSTSDLSQTLPDHLYTVEMDTSANALEVNDTPFDLQGNLEQMPTDGIVPENAADKKVKKKKKVTKSTSDLSQTLPNDLYTTDMDLSQHADVGQDIDQGNVEHIPMDDANPENDNVATKKTKKKKKVSKSISDLSQTLPANLYSTDIDVSGTTDAFTEVQTLERPKKVKKTKKKLTTSLGDLSVNEVVNEPIPIDIDSISKPTETSMDDILETGIPHPEHTQQELVISTDMPQSLEQNLYFPSQHFETNVDIEMVNDRQHSSNDILLENPKPMEIVTIHQEGYKENIPETETVLSQIHVTDFDTPSGKQETNIDEIFDGSEVTSSPNQKVQMPIIDVHELGNQHESVRTDTFPENQFPHTEESLIQAQSVETIIEEKAPKKKKKSIKRVKESAEPDSERAKSLPPDVYKSLNTSVDNFLQDSTQTETSDKTKKKKVVKKKKLNKSTSDLTGMSTSLVEFDDQPAAENSNLKPKKKKKTKSISDIPSSDIIAVDINVADADLTTQDELLQPKEPQNNIHEDNYTETTLDDVLMNQDTVPDEMSVGAIAESLKPKTGEKKKKKKSIKEDGENAPKKTTKNKKKSEEVLDPEQHLESNNQTMEVDIPVFEPSTEVDMMSQSIVTPAIDSPPIETTVLKKKSSLKKKKKKSEESLDTEQQLHSNGPPVEADMPVFNPPTNVETNTQNGVYPDSPQIETSLPKRKSSLKKKKSLSKSYEENNNETTDVTEQRENEEPKIVEKAKKKKITKKKGQDQRTNDSYVTDEVKVTTEPVKSLQDMYKDIELIDVQAEESEEKDTSVSSEDVKIVDEPRRKDTIQSPPTTVSTSSTFPASNHAITSNPQSKPLSKFVPFTPSKYANVPAYEPKKYDTSQSYKSYLESRRPSPCRPWTDSLFQSPKKATITAPDKSSIIQESKMRSLNSSVDDYVAKSMERLTDVGSTNNSSLERSSSLRKQTKSLDNLAVALDREKGSAGSSHGSKANADEYGLQSYNTYDDEDEDQRRARMRTKSVDNLTLVQQRNRMESQERSLENQGQRAKSTGCLLDGRLSKLGRRTFTQEILYETVTTKEEVIVLKKPSVNAPEIVGDETKSTVEKTREARRNFLGGMMIVDVYDDTNTEKPAKTDKKSSRHDSSSDSIKYQHNVSNLSNESFDDLKDFVKSASSNKTKTETIIIASEKEQTSPIKEETMTSEKEAEITKDQPVSVEVQAKEINVPVTTLYAKTVDVSSVKEKTPLIHVEQPVVVPIQKDTRTSPSKDEGIQTQFPDIPATPPTVQVDKQQQTSRDIAVQVCLDSDYSSIKTPPPSPVKARKFMLDAGTSVDESVQVFIRPPPPTSIKDEMVETDQQVSSETVLLETTEVKTDNLSGKPAETVSDTSDSDSSTDSDSGDSYDASQEPWTCQTIGKVIEEESEFLHTIKEESPEPNLSTSPPKSSVILTETKTVITHEGVDNFPTTQKPVIPPKPDIYVPSCRVNTPEAKTPPKDPENHSKTGEDVYSESWEEFVTYEYEYDKVTGVKRIVMKPKVMDISETQVFTSLDSDVQPLPKPPRKEDTRNLPEISEDSVVVYEYGEMISMYNDENENVDDIYLNNNADLGTGGSEGAVAGVERAIDIMVTQELEKVMHDIATDKESDDSISRSVDETLQQCQIQKNSAPPRYEDVVQNIENYRKDSYEINVQNMTPNLKRAVQMLKSKYNIVRMSREATPIPVEFQTDNTEFQYPMNVDSLPRQLSETGSETQVDEDMMEEIHDEFESVLDELNKMEISSRSPSRQGPQYEKPTDSSSTRSSNSDGTVVDTISDINDIESVGTNQNESFGVDNDDSDLNESDDQVIFGMDDVFVKVVTTKDGTIKKIKIMEGIEGGDTTKITIDDDKYAIPPDHQPPELDNMHFNPQNEQLVGEETRSLVSPPKIIITEPQSPECDLNLPECYPEQEVYHYEDSASETDSEDQDSVIEAVNYSQRSIESLNESHEKRDSEESSGTEEDDDYESTESSDDDDDDDDYYGDAMNGIMSSPGRSLSPIAEEEDPPKVLEVEQQKSSSEASSDGSPEDSEEEDMALLKELVRTDSRRSPSPIPQRFLDESHESLASDSTYESEELLQVTSQSMTQSSISPPQETDESDEVTSSEEASSSSLVDSCESPFLDDDDMVVQKMAVEGVLSCIDKGDSS